MSVVFKQNSKKIIEFNFNTEEIIAYDSSGNNPINLSNVSNIQTVNTYCAEVNCYNCLEKQCNNVHCSNCTTIQCTTIQCTTVECTTENCTVCTKCTNCSSNCNCSTDEKDE